MMGSSLLWLALGSASAASANAAAAASAPAVSSAPPSGSFWIVTDWHINNGFNATPPKLDSALGSTQKQCNTRTNISSLRPGRYGAFGCDSNLVLFRTAVAFMARTQPAPDFILWQGDNYGHVAPPDTEALVLGSTALLADLLSDAFPGVPILPAVGNHDTYPYNSDPGATFYAKICALWAPWLDAPAMKSCSLAGYFSVLLRKGLRAISLNSQHQSATMLLWAAAQLAKAKVAGEKVRLVVVVVPVVVVLLLVLLLVVVVVVVLLLLLLLVLLLVPLLVLVLLVLVLLRR